MINRRQLLGVAGAFSTRALAQSRAVTLDRLEVFDLPVNRRGSWLLLRLSTASGLKGVGEASQSPDQPLTISTLRKFAGLLKGRGIFEIEWLKQQAEKEGTRNRAIAAALSALEQCLWDLQGKALGVPVYQLLGGALNRRIRTYANINRSTPDRRAPEDFAVMAQRAMAAGFDATKLAPFDDMPAESAGAQRLEEFAKLGLERAAAVRQVIGPKADLLIDAHSHFNRARGLDIAKRIEPLNLYWLEEVTPAVPLDDLAAIRKAAKMPTAGGELIYGTRGFYPYIAAGTVDIVMPDVKYCGGVFEMKKIAALAEGAGLRVSPHGPASPLGNAVAAHVCASVPNCPILELSYGEVPWRAEVIDPAEVLDHGYLTVNDRPGFGCDLNEKTLSARGARL